MFVALLEQLRSPWLAGAGPRQTTGTSRPATASGAAAGKRRYDEHRAKGVKIGERCHLYGTEFDRLAPFLIEIGDEVSLASNVRIFAHDGAFIHHTNQARFAKVRILDRCFIGSDTIVLPGVTIGPGSIVGAGSVVSRDVPPGELWAGNPARRIGTVAEACERAQGRPDTIWLDMPPHRPEDPDFAEGRKAWRQRVADLHRVGHFD